MKCIHCGKENPSKNIYCQSCGQYIYGQGGQPYGNHQRGHYYEAPLNSNQNNNTKLILAGIISFFVVFIVVACIGYFIIFKTDDKKTQNETEIKVTQESINVSSLSELKMEYETKFTNYNINEQYQTRVQSLHTELDQAMTDNKTEKAETLRASYAALETEIAENNKVQVDGLRAEIARVDVSGATATQNAELTRYNDRVSETLQVGNYKGAISELEGYLNYSNSVKQESDERSAKEQEYQQKAQVQQQQVPVVSNSEYLIPYSSTQYITFADIANFSTRELVLARNEIFARHGRKFVDETIQAYFNEKSWYQGIYEPEEISFKELTDIEKKNVKFIEKYE